MDLLLTPLVTRLLKQYVKRSSEGAGRDLKVSFSRGNVLTLHNLELNLAPLLGGAAALAHVRRAFARRLSITIPWTALITQPIQVVLDTVELVLSAADDEPPPTPMTSASALSEAGSRQALADEEAAAAAAGGGGAGAGWFGSALQSLALRAGLNVTVKLTNVVAKWVQEEQFVAAVTLQELLLQTSTDDWAQGLQNPEAWLKKECSIRQLSVSLDGAPAAAPGAAPPHSYQPLLRVASLSASALLPAFAWLEGADLAGDAFNTSVDVRLAPLHVAINDRQLRWAGILVAVMQAAAAAKSAAAAAEEAAAAEASTGLGSPVKPAITAAWGSPATPAALLAATPGASPSPAQGAAAMVAAAAAAPRPQTKALGVFGRVWDFLIDEASYVETADGPPSPSQGLPGSSPPASASLPHQLPAVPMYSELQVLLEGLDVALGLVVDRTQQPAAAAAEGGSEQPPAQQQQALSQAPDLEDTLRQLRAATASNSVAAAAALQQQLVAALAAADGGGGSGMQRLQQHHPPAYEVHHCAELRLHQLKVAVASVDASISGVAVELHQLTLRRSTAAAPLLGAMLTPGGAASGAAAAVQPDRLALAAAVAAAGSSSWVEVLSLEAEQPVQAASPPEQQQQQQKQQQLAVSVHFFDSAAAPGGARPQGSPTPGQLRCTARVGRLLVAHAPGFVSNLLLLARQYEAGAAAAAMFNALPVAGSSPLPRPAAPASDASQPEGAAAGERSGGASGSSSPSSLAQALQPQLLVECRLAQVELLALSSQAPEAAAVALLLRQLDLHSGALNWEAPWNTRLRHTLLAPAQGFAGHGLRLSLAAAELAVADATTAASGDCGGLWQLQRAEAVSNVFVLDAVVATAVAAAPASPAGTAAPGAGPGPDLMLSAALSPWQLRLAGQQAAAVAAVCSGISAEASHRFEAPLLLAAADPQEASWLASCSLSSTSGLQLAYASAGDLRQWHDPHGSTAITQSSAAGGSSDPAIFLSVGTVVAALAASPAPAGAAAAAAAHPHARQLLLQLRLLDAHAWLAPAVDVRLPAAEARLGWAAQQGSPTMLPEPLLLAGALRFSRRSTELQHEEGEGGQLAGGRQRLRSAVHLGSASLTLSAADYPLALALLRCVRQQPALPPWPALRPAGVVDHGQADMAAAAAAAGEEGPAREAAAEEEELEVCVDAASITLWPQQQSTQQQQQRPQQVGVALWLSRLQLSTQHHAQGGSGGGSGRTEMTLDTAQIALLRHQQPANGSNGSTVEFSQVLCFPGTSANPAKQRQQQQQPALQLTLISTWPGGGGGCGATMSPSKSQAAAGRQLQLQAAPLDLALSGEVMAALGTLSADLDSTLPASAGQPSHPDATPSQAAGEAESLQGKAALEGLRVRLLEAAAWGSEDAAGSDREAGGGGGGGWQPPAGAAAAEVVVEELLVLLQQTPVAENRPWLAGSSGAAAALLSSADASLIGVAITVWHAGPPGADATAMLLPTDGRLQLLLQPHTGAVGVAAHAQLLPLQVSLPSVDALTAVINAVTCSDDDSTGEQRASQQRQQQHSQRQSASRQRPLPAASAAAVAAAATVIIEDASATLGRPLHSHNLAAPVPAAVRGDGGAVAASPPAGQQQPADDLSAALFTFVHSRGDSSAETRPAPLQVQVFSGGGGGSDDESPRGGGLGSRLGARLWGSGRQVAQPRSGEAARLQGIRWCYPQQREVVLLAVEDPPAALLAATWELGWYLAEDDAYLSVDVRAVTLNSIGAVGSPRGKQLLLLLAEEACAAAEWELRWELPAGTVAGAGAAAAAVLQRLRINPRHSADVEAAMAAGLGRQLRVPAPLAASLTVVLTAEAGSLALLAATPLLQQHQHHKQQHPQARHHKAATAMLDTVAVLHAGSLRAAVHTYPAPEGSTVLAADVQAALALCLPDSSSATAPADSAAATLPGWGVVEPFLLDAAVEFCSGAAGPLQPYPGPGQEQTRREQQRTGRSQQHEQATAVPPFWRQQQQQELPMLAVRPPPTRQGLALHLGVERQPLTVNASEAALAEVRRLVALLSGPSDASSSSRDVEGSPTAATTSAAPLLVVNQGGRSVWLRQQGTSQHRVLLQSGQRLPFVWPAPPALVPGATRRLQLALATAAVEDAAAWSTPVDVMAAGGHPLLLRAPDGCSAMLAVQVRHASGGGWEAVLLPAVRVENHLSVPLHLCLTNDVPAAPSSGSSKGSPAARQQQHALLDVRPSGCADTALHSFRAVLRLWLGGDVSSGGGWSQAVSMPRFRGAQPEPLLMVLHCSPAAAASAVGAGVRPPTAPDAAVQQLGAVLAQLLPPDGASGQVTVRLWPSLLLRNAMPCPVRLLLPVPASAVPGQPASPQQQRLQHHEVVLPAGGSQQLTVPLRGGTVGAFVALEPPGEHTAGSSSSSSDGGGGGGGMKSPGVAVVVPPLIAESAEQQWFGAGSGARQAAGSGAPLGAAALFIAPPGEAVCLQLPVRVDLPSGLPGAAGGGGSGSTVVQADCLLVTQQHTDGVPLLQLTLRPALAVHNCLPLPLVFQVPGMPAVSVPAGASLPLPAGRSSSGGAAEEATVLLLVAAGGTAAQGGGALEPSQQQAAPDEGQRQLLLKSQPLKLECEDGEGEGGGEGGGSSSTQLLLVSEPPAAARSASGLWRSAGAASARVECHLAARVQVERHSAAGGTATAGCINVTLTAGGFMSNLTGLPLAMLAEGVAAGAALPTTAAPAAPQPPGALAPQNSGVSLTSADSVGALPAVQYGERQGTLLPHAATLPLLQLWHAGGHAAQRQGSWSRDVLRSFGGSLLSAPSQQAGGAAGPPCLRVALAGPPGAFALDPELPTPRPTLQEGGEAAEATLCWSPTLLPFVAGGRERLYLQQPGSSGRKDGSTVMLTYRVLQTGGCFHLVLFRDRQPPFIVQNATGGAVELGFFPPAEAGDGSYTYPAAPSAAMRVTPGHTLECDFTPAGGEGSNGQSDGSLSPRRSAAGAAGGWADQEDEDAFLDCLLREELQAAGQGQQRPPPVLKFRAAGSTEWRHPCALLPGLHVAAPSSGSSGRTTPRAGEDPEADTEAQLGEVHVSKCCATTRILLLPAAAAAVPAAAAAAVAAEQAEEEEAAAAARPIPLRLEVRLAQLQLCLWDDERRRLLPGGGTSSGGGGGSPLGRELFSLSLQQLDMQLSRSYFVAAGCSGTTGGAGAQPHAWQRQALAVLAARFSAAALQLDSYLPASEQRVLLTSLPVDDVGHGAPRRTRRGPPLQLALEVHHCLPASEGGADGGGGMSFRKAWVHDLLVQLPTLAAAADDELLLFAERLSGLMSAADGSRQSSTGGDEGTAGGAGASSVGSVSPRHAAAGGAATQPASRMDLLQQSLAAEAAGAAASRLYIEQAVVEAVRLLLDAHIAAGTAGVPVAVDTHRAPVTLSRIAAHNVLFRPHILVRGLMAHGVAEALLNAPQVLGSLSLLFNPTGLVQSVRAGVSDLIGLPLAALQNQSLTEFVSGVGMGSVSLVKHTLGWTLTSISGFSQAFSRAVDSAVTLRTGTAGGGAGGGALAHRPPPSHLGHGLTQGLAGLAEGVAAGITGVVRAPLQGYSSGSGVLGGIGRGLLGAVGLPVSGALELVGSVSAGLASSAGVVHVPQPRRPGRLLTAGGGGGAAGTASGSAGSNSAAGPTPLVTSAARLMQHPALLGHSATFAAGDGLGRYLAHAALMAATVLQGAEGLRGTRCAAGHALQQPVLLVTQRAAVLFSAGGLAPVLVLLLAETETDVWYASHEITLFSQVAAPAGRPDAAAPAAVACQLSREAWLRLAPLLRGAHGSR